MNGTNSLQVNICNHAIFIHVMVNKVKQGKRKDYNKFLYINHKPRNY